MADASEFHPDNLEIDQFLMFDEIYEDPPHSKSENGKMQESNGDSIGNYGTDFSGTRLEEDNVDGNGNCNAFDPQNFGFGNPIKIPIWPVPPSPHSCTCCQTLREFFHVNGSHVSKLEIHGRLGMINHAVLERYRSDISTPNHEYIMFEREGYTMLQDPLSNFYDALCIGLDGYGNIDTDVFVQQSSKENRQTNENDNLNQPEEDGNGERLNKSHLASQRERTGKLKLRDLEKYFHLPISVAAKEMNICSSAIKGICRKEGLMRWPYRKIKSIENEIAKKTKILDSNNADERNRALTQIKQLQQRIASFYEAHEHVG